MRASHDAIHSPIDWLAGGKVAKTGGFEPRSARFFAFFTRSDTQRIGY